MTGRKRAAPIPTATSQTMKNRPSLPFPLLGIPDLDTNAGMEDMLDEQIDDSELEAELRALMSGKEIPPRKAQQTVSSGVRPPPIKPRASAPAPSSRNPSRGTSQTSQTAPSNNALRILDLTILEKIGLEEGDDVLESGDEDDPELLAELEDLWTSEHDGGNSGVSSENQHSNSSSANTHSQAAVQGSPGSSSMVDVLQSRIENYNGARQDALDEKDANKVRRCDRAIKTLHEQLKRAKNGEVVPEEEIPPPNFIKSALDLMKPLAESKPFPSEPSKLSDKSEVSPLSAEAPPSVPNIPIIHPHPVLPKEHQTSADVLRNRQHEYKMAALNAKKTGNMEDAKRFFIVVKQFDSVIKAADEGTKVDLSEMPPHPDQLPYDEKKKPVQCPPAPGAKSVPEDVSADIPEINAAEVKEVFGAPEAPKTVMEALEQRLKKYQSTAQEAKLSGDASKTRRLERIVKQYQQAIADHKAKRPVNFEELPVPPGYAPIPSGPSTKVAPAAARVPVSDSTGAPGKSANSGPLTAAALHHPSSRESRQEQQYHLLVERQKQLKLAALKAKKEGAMETAKHYLRQALQLDQMIEASANGIPVDVATIPKAPTEAQTDNDFQVISYEDVGAERPPDSHKSRSETYMQLEKDLVEQTAMCARNALHFKKFGDIPLSEKFDKFQQHSRKDLESLRSAFKHTMPVPKFHYETRVFSVVKCCPELPDNVIELTIVRGFGYTLSGFSPVDFTTCVKYDFPFPAEAPQSGRTGYFGKTNEPEYNSVHRININRKSRSLGRIFKTKGITCEVIVKMGFLKGEKVLGTCHISLEALETRCVHHTAVDLMEGKRAVGGKLEVLVRIREPILKQQVEELKEKWLVIDQFIR